MVIRGNVRCYPFQGGQQRFGMAIVAVLGLFLFLLICFVTFSFSAMQSRHTTVSLISRETAFNVAQMSADLYWATLEETFRTRKGCSALFPTTAPPSDAPFYLKPGSASPRTMRVSAEDLSLSPALSQLCNKMGCQNITAIADVNLSQVEPPFPTMSAATGRICLDISVQVSPKQKFRFLFPRSFRLSQFIPPVVGKFTFFARECSNPEMFNLCQSSFGEPAKEKELTLIHHPDDFSGKGPSEFWKKTGWVFLGGNKVILNLSGVHPAVNTSSEMFLFFPRAAFAARTRDLPSFIFPVKGAEPWLKVRSTPMGCFKELAENPMLSLILQDPSFTVKEPNLGRTSALHLFGSAKLRRTPTKVFGKVFSRYTLFNSIIIDTNNDGIPDEIPLHEYPTFPIETSSCRAIFPIFRFTERSKYYPSIVPKLLHARYQWLELPEVCFRSSLGTIYSVANLFPKYVDAASGKGYASFMSRISTSDFGEEGSDEPGRMACANFLYDTAFANTDEESTVTFPPSSNFAPEDYPNSGTNFPGGKERALADMLAGGKTVNLQTFDLANLYEAWQTKLGFFSHYVPNAEECQATIFHREGSLLQINSPTSVFVDGEAGLDLSQGLFLRAPLLIVAKKDILLGKVTVDPLLTPPPKLVAVSLKGSIKITGGPLAHSFLLAPNGEISWNTSLSLQGGVCAKTFNGDVLRTYGGVIEYDKEFDPLESASVYSCSVPILGPPLPPILEE